MQPVKKNRKRKPEMNSQCRELTVSLLWKGVCSYNNADSNEPIFHYCRDRRPVSVEDSDEAEYRSALTSKSARDIFAFLRKWGMSRVLGKKKIDSFRLGELLRESEDKFRILKGATLVSYSRETVGTQVKLVFDFFREQLGPVAPGKIIHILQPELFPPWDGWVRGLMGVKDHYSDSRTSEDYLDYLDICKHDLSVLSRTGKSVQQLEITYYENGWKPITKILDELRWSQAKCLAPHFGTNRK